MENQAENMFNFMNLDIQAETIQLIHRSTHPENPNYAVMNNHIRDPKTVVTNWRSQRDMQEINQIQNDPNCIVAMKLWGYNVIKNQNDVSQRPMSPFSFD
jgi:hypothetical protein